MRSPGINGGELRGQPANPGSPGKMATKTECVCVYSCSASSVKMKYMTEHGNNFKTVYSINVKMNKALTFSGLKIL